ncbi:MAG: NAD(P)H-dependent oxidoreductase [Spirochaetota bacterium]
MMDKRKALLLVGSPRGAKSTSNALGSYLLDRLLSGGMETEKIFILQTLQSGEAIERMLAAVEAADLVIFAFPLYVDHLPAPVIKTLELIAGNRRIKPARHPQTIASIVNCGFPESHQNRPAGEIMRHFAGKTGFTWAGSLVMGMGEAVAGRPLMQAGGLVRNVVKALDLAAEALCAGQQPPEEAFRLMGKQLIPRWLYVFMGNLGWKSRAGKSRVKINLYARPYELS